MNRIVSLAVSFAFLFAACTQAQDTLDHGKGHFGAVFTAAFSPDGKKIVTASYDGTVRIWDVESSEELHTLKAHSGHSAGVNSAVFSPDGKKVVTAGPSGDGRRDNGTVRIWDVETGKEIRELEGYEGTCHTAVFSPDGKKVVATTDWVKHVLVWNADTGEIIQKLEGHTDRIHSASFSSDGKRIVTSSWDNTARIWDAETGKELKKLEGPTTEILAFGGGRIAAGIRPAAFSPDGKKVVAATCTKDVPGANAILIFDVESGKVLQKLDRNMMNQVKSVSFSPDGKKVVASYRGFMDNNQVFDTLIWDAESGKELLKLSDGNYAVFSPDGKSVMTVRDNAVTIWDAESGKELKKWQWEISYWMN
jgi:WD40 repeat protein